jgi:hypothetical protein
MVVVIVEPVAGVHDAPVVPDASGVAVDPSGTLVHLDGLTAAVGVAVPATSPYLSRVLPRELVRRSVAVLGECRARPLGLHARVRGEPRPGGEATAAHAARVRRVDLSGLEGARYEASRRGGVERGFVGAHGGGVIPGPWWTWSSSPR